MNARLRLSSERRADRVDAAVVGGGIMGLGIAGELARCFDRVDLIERGYCAGEATRAAGGMLAPFSELEFGEPELFEFNRQSLRDYPAFVKELVEETGMGVGFRSTGTFYVARFDDHRATLERLHGQLQRVGWEGSWRDGDWLCCREPLLGQNVQGGLYLPREKIINNRWLSLALMIRCRERGVRVRTGETVQEIQYGEEGNVACLQTSHGSVRPRQVVIAAGAWSGRIDGLKPEDQMPVRPVKGQALALRPGPGFEPGHVIRSPDFYGVPHRPERFLVGATMEEVGFDDRITAGRIRELLQAVGEVLPAAADRDLLETWAGFRPASLDSRPILGPSSVTDNLTFACGHYRHGILQAPRTIRLVTNWLTQGELSPHLEPFLPGRFQDLSDPQPSPVRG